MRKALVCLLLRYESVLRLAVSMAAIAAITVGCDRQPYVPLPALPTGAVCKPLTRDDIRMPRKIAAASCNIESVDQIAFSGRPMPLASREILVSGWLLPEISHKAVARASLRFLNESGTTGWQASIEGWTKRPDVLSGMHAPKGGDVGFARDIDIGPMMPGTYRLFVTFDDGGVSYICDKGRIVIVQ
jgi:hypothetical protein